MRRRSRPDDSSHEYVWLPEIDENGLLPVGVYTCDTNTFHNRFVELLPERDERERLWEGFERICEEASEYDINGTQWVNGSFVTSEPHPGDIDVVTFIEYDALEDMDRAAQDFVENILNGQLATQERYGVHAMVVPACTPEHPYFPAYESWRRYWRNERFGSVKNRAGGRKGFVELVLGDRALAPTVSRDES